jgi:hypothetical protein
VLNSLTFAQLKREYEVVPPHRGIPGGKAELRKRNSSRPISIATSSIRGQSSSTRQLRIVRATDELTSSYLHTLTMRQRLPEQVSRSPIHSQDALALPHPADTEHRIRDSPLPL